MYRRYAIRGYPLSAIDRHELTGVFILYGIPSMMARA